MIDDEPTFGTLLKRSRRAAHLTQEELAERAGYSSHYVSMLERGGSLIAPSGGTRLEAGDYVYVIAPAEDRPHVELLFGLPEEH